MIDFDIPSMGLKINEREVYELNKRLRKEIENGPFRRDWLIKLEDDYIKQLKRDCEHLIIGEYRHKIHPYLRRYMNYEHSINVDLINCLCYIGERVPNLEIGLAVDPESIQSKDQIYSKIVELERGFGIHYNLLKIIEKLLKYKKTIKSIYYRSNHTGLMVLIGLKEENILEFNIYEFTLNKANNYFINRSIHAYHNINLNFYSHVDGKVLLFEEEGYDPLKLEINRRPKRKLFRIDGQIPNEFFISLSSRFFFENNLISEFFNPGDIENNLLKNLVDD